MIRLIIEGDVNDGDYVTKITDLEEETLDYYYDIFIMIQDYSKEKITYNYERIFTEMNRLAEIEENDLVDLWYEFVENFVPSHPENFLHTITSIKFFEAPEEEWEVI